MAKDDRNVDADGGAKRVLSTGIALLHEGELVDTVPAEPHDRPVHGVITPRGGLTLNRAAEWTK